MWNKNIDISKELLNLQYSKQLRGYYYICGVESRKWVVKNTIVMVKLHVVTNIT